MALNDSWPVAGSGAEELEAALIVTPPLITSSSGGIRYLIRFVNMASKSKCYFACIAGQWPGGHEQSSSRQL